MGRASRQKGKVGERELANALSRHGIKARRGQQFRGDPTAPDVIGEGALARFLVEVKRRERSSDLFAWVRDLELLARSGGKLGVLFHRRNRTRWIAVLTLEDFVAIVHALEAAGRELSTTYQPAIETREGGR